MSQRVLRRLTMCVAATRTRAARGASAVEYGLLITGVAAVIVAAVFFFGGSVGGLFTDTCDTIKGARSAANSC